MSDATRTSVWLPGELYRAIRAAARRSDQSIAGWVRQAARERLERDCLASACSASGLSNWLECDCPEAGQ